MFNEEGPTRNIFICESWSRSNKLKIYLRNYTLLVDKSAPRFADSETTQCALMVPKQSQLGPQVNIDVCCFVFPLVPRGVNCSETAEVCHRISMSK
jgi:hypothetical protein